MSEPNLYQRGGVWWFRATVDGVEIRESLRCRNVKTARKIRDKKLEELAARRAGVEREKWEDAVTAWTEHVIGQISPKTAMRYAVSLAQCEPFLAGLTLERITKTTIAEMSRRRRQSGATAATIRRDLTAISQVLTFAAARGQEAANPTLEFRRTLKERRDPIVLPTREQIEKVMAAAPARFGRLIRAAELTGCRQDELVTARWRNFDRQAGTLLIYRGKGNKSRTISLDGAASAHILGTVRVLKSDVIFSNEEGQEWANPSSNFSQLTLRISETDKAFERFRFHDLRHFYAVRALAGGMDLWTLSRQLGHTSVKVTESTYLQFLTPEQAEEARRPPAQNSAHLTRFAEDSGVGKTG